MTLLTCWWDLKEEPVGGTLKRTAKLKASKPEMQTIIKPCYLPQTDQNPMEKKSTDDCIVEN